MTQAFYSAIGGMNAGQTKINVVADNIANMNTVGFKSSSVQFSDVYYRTSSSGKAASGTMGGTNPMQIGIGVQTSAITRDFSAGTTLATGKSTDLCIQGSGFFTVASPTVDVMYTRAGNFEVDANGNLVMPNGFKVLGTDSFLDTTASTTPIKIPTCIKTETTPSTEAQMGNKKLSELNGVSISEGTFTVNVTQNPGGTTPHEITITADTTINSLIADLNDAGVDASIVDGKLSITAQGDDTLSFENGTSNFVTAANLQDTADASTSFETDIVDFHQTIGEGTSDITNAENFTSVTVSENGVIEVKYANNDTLSVMQDPSNPGKMILKYTLNDGTVISGDDITIEGGVVEPANLQIQMASFINPNGLVANGNNTYTAGLNSGMTLFGSVASGAFGLVQSGVLEGSNVDLSEQFSQMIMAQRAIEANSRVFDASSQIMQTMSYLGKG